MISKFSIIMILLFSSVISSEFTYKDLPVLQSGRVKPFDTYARNHLLQYYGKSSIKKTEFKDKVKAIDWMFNVFVNSDEEIDRQIFNVRNPEVSFSLGLNKNDDHRYSFNEILTGFRENQELLEVLKIKDEENQSLVDKQIIEIYQNILSFDQIAHSFYCFLPLVSLTNQTNRDFMGLEANEPVSYSYFMRNFDKFRFLLQNLIDTDESKWNASHLELSQVAMQLESMTQFQYAQSIKIIPYDDDEWKSPWELMDGRKLTEFESKILSLYEKLFYHFTNNDIDLANNYATKIIDEINSKKNINKSLLPLETLYNDIDMFLYSIVFYILSFFLVGISWMISNNYFRIFSLFSMIIGFILHGLGLLLRMIIMQRPPVSTLYESIIFVGLILVLFSLIFEYYRKDTVGILIASIGGSFLHFVGFKYAADGDTLGVLVAVLNSNFWLATHVTTITTGYGVTLVAGLMAHIYLVINYINPKNKVLLNKIYNNAFGLTLLGLFFTMFGTILGGIWADQSWGRFWGWDPKENGALLIVLWLLMVMHLKISGVVKKIGYIYALSLVNIIVALAWFGVNLLNVGLHSYGFTDNVAMNLFIFIIFELIFTSSFYYLIKKRKIKNV